jgi:hypothetical protein
MWKIALAALVVIALAVAYFTNPKEPAHRDAARALLSEAQEEAAERIDLNAILDLGVAHMSTSGRYQSFFLASKYAIAISGEASVECWGAFACVRCARTE